ncbi:MAG: hypothetical protein J6C33_10475 [Lachnospiraceae bacterium]|nr:hypothetical protein [Lachnospiraceae bacterium]
MGNVIVQNIFVLDEKEREEKVMNILIEEIGKESGEEIWKYGYEPSCIYA